MARRERRRRAIFLFDLGTVRVPQGDGLGLVRVAPMQHASSTTKTETTITETVIAMILRSGRIEPGKVKNVVDTPKQAMPYVTVCSPDRKTEVLKRFLEVTKPDAVDTASESASEDGVTQHEELPTNRSLRLCSKVIRITADLPCVPV